ncbi:ABC transporter ATP-binding protein [Roseovarius indicus]|uniref:ABC transporter ATP-binding protein n=1 Tax=Roseovarius indicus TaxID=540747 RepID=UPI0040581E85
MRDLQITLSTATGPLHAVRGISFEVGMGETVCIVGESGCGKSITSLSVMGLLPKKADVRAEVLRFGDQNLLKLNERQLSSLRGDKLAMIFQEPMTALNPVYTIGDQLTEPLLRHRKITKREAYALAEKILEKVGISGAARRMQQFPHQLSGGLRQRIVIAMALICEPKLVIADEPTTALDVTIQAQILHLMKDLQREFGMGMLFITHDLGLVSRIADRVLVMYAGQIVESGTVAEIFDRPSHPYTQGLMQCLPSGVRARPGARLGSIPGIVPNLVGGIKGCGFASRCPAVREKCRSSDIALRAVGGTQAARCILPPEEVAGLWTETSGLEIER